MDGQRDGQGDGHGRAGGVAKTWAGRERTQHNAAVRADAKERENERVTEKERCTFAAAGSEEAILTTDQNCPALAMPGPNCDGAAGVERAGGGRAVRGRMERRAESGLARA